MEDGVVCRADALQELSLPSFDAGHGNGAAQSEICPVFIPGDHAM
jgi:hypothetical protein